MLSTTLREGLEDYAIGEKIRALRLKKKMGLVELGRHTGLSPALLSKVERGRLFPTLPTLLRIALVFSVGLEYFFTGAREVPFVAIVRRGDRLKFPEKMGARQYAYQFQSLDYPAVERPFNAYYAEFFPLDPEKIKLHQHAGFELIYVVNGSLTVLVGDQDHLLQPGDAMYFDATTPHGYRRSGGRSCAALVVTAAGQPQRSREGAAAPKKPTVDAKAPNP